MVTGVNNTPVEQWIIHSDDKYVNPINDNDGDTLIKCVTKPLFETVEKLSEEHSSWVTK